MEFGRAPRTLTRHDTEACARKHLDQRVNAEQLDLPTHKITDTRLRDTEKISGLGLSQLAGSNQFAQERHKVRANPEVRRLPR